MSERPRRLHQIERAVLALYAFLIGAPSLVAVILPRAVLREISHSPPLPSAILFAQLLAGAQIGLALVALVAALVPRPPLMLLRALMIALCACLAGPLFSAMTQASVYAADLRALLPLLLLHGVVALLLGTFLLLERLVHRA